MMFAGSLSVGLMSESPSQRINGRQTVFPALLRKWRLRREMSQEQLAEAIDATQGLISQYETGVTEVGISTLYELATALRCRPIDLLENAPEDVEPVLSVWRELGSRERKLGLALLESIRTATD